MKPIVLGGHLRAITRTVFNREGDLIFVSSKDKSIHLNFFF